jgi:hypothetical protein
MEKTEDDVRWNPYSDSLKRRNSAMREILRMVDRPIGEPPSGQAELRTRKLLNNSLLRMIAVIRRVD